MATNEIQPVTDVYVRGWVDEDEHPQIQVDITGPLGGRESFCSTALVGPARITVDGIEYVFPSSSDDNV